MFNRVKSKKAFTLVEMLVVIAIIAVLVAIIIPTVSKATTKAKAATDAANLRTILGEANIRLVETDQNLAAAFADLTTFSCETFPGGKACVAYKEPGFMEAYYVADSKYYSLDYFQEVADKGDASSANQPTTSVETGYTLYEVGTGTGHGTQLSTSGTGN